MLTSRRWRRSAWRELLIAVSRLPESGVFQNEIEADGNRVALLLRLRPQGEFGTNGGGFFNALELDERFPANKQAKAQ